MILNVNPEDGQTNKKKFIKRFQYLELKQVGVRKPLMDMTLAEMDVFFFFGRGLKL
jgi:XTP/dITP diphosphohydrolase